MKGLGHLFSISLVLVRRLLVENICWLFVSPFVVSAAAAVVCRLVSILALVVVG